MASKLERLYPYVPVFVQNLGISLFGLAWRHERLGGRFEEYVGEFRERERWEAERFDDHMQGALQRTLLHAFAQVPYYRDRWSKAGIRIADLNNMTVERLSRLPSTPKQDLRSAPESFVAQDVAARAKLNRYCSSGSTGTPSPPSAPRLRIVGTWPPGKPGRLAGLAPVCGNPAR